MKNRRNAGPSDAGENPELIHFAGEFRDEAHLRQVTAQLFEKMGFASVIITHGGPTEKGKDLIFYSKGALGETVLCACVVKNDRITGSASSQEGAPTVLNQAVQALLEPHVNRTSGQQERVNCVYIISPLTPTVTAIEAIQNQLRERSGGVVFKCGRDFYDLFQTYWPDFLRFETGILTRYLAALETGLDHDPAIITLLLRQGINPGERTIESFYVQPRLYIEIAAYSINDDCVLNPKQLNGPLLLETVADLQKRIRAWAEMLRISGIWASRREDVPEFIKVGERASILASALRKIWERQFGLYERARSKEQATKIKKSDVRLDVDFDKRTLDEYEAVCAVTARAMDALRTCVGAATQLGKKTLHADSALLNDPEYITYCRLEDLAQTLPGLLKRGEVIQRLEYTPSILDQTEGPVLISAPAGFGKSWFCRWHTLDDARRHAFNREGPLPIYVTRLMHQI